MLGLHPCLDITFPMAEPDGGLGSTSRPRQEGTDADTPDTSARHTPALFGACLDMFIPGLSGEGRILVDCTLGMGGHPETILKRLHDTRLIDINHDSQVIAFTLQRLVPFASRFTAVRTTHDHIDEVAV